MPDSHIYYSFVLSWTEGGRREEEELALTDDVEHLAHAMQEAMG